MYTQRQIAALKYLIFNAKIGDQLTKRLLAFLIEQSAGLTKEVCITLVENREGYSGKEIHDAAMGLSSMQSCNCSTHLNEIMKVMGGEFGFSSHYGSFEPGRVGDPFNNSGQFAGLDVSQVTSPDLVLEGQPTRYTFWLAKENYSRKANLEVATREMLENINLEKSGLYPNLEPK